MQIEPHALMSQIAMHNVDTTVDGLMDRAVVQRTNLYDVSD